MRRDDYADARNALADAKAAVQSLVRIDEPVAVVQILHDALGHLEAARLSVEAAATTTL